MKFLFFSNIGISALHFGVELELVQNILNEKRHEVYSVSCNSSLKTCYFNPTHNLIGCAICEGRTQTLYKKHHANSVNYLKLKTFKKAKTVENINSVADLISISYRDVNVGRGIASSIISLFKEDQITKISNHQKVIQEHYETTTKIVDNFIHYIDDIQPDVVYLFNGRFAEVYPIVEICKLRNINYITHEAGGNNSVYRKFMNTNVHSIIDLQKSLEEINKKTSLATIQEKGKKWFENRQKGNQGMFNFVKKQKQDKLPDNFNSNKRNIAIFNSSEYEVKVIKSWETDLFKNQSQAVEKIVSHFSNQPDFYFYLRIHPNLIHLNNTQIEALNSIKAHNITIIQAHEDISTYKLIESCEKTLTFGSTVGLEATYLKKPSIVFGHSFYEYLQVTYNPKSFTQLYDLVQKKALPPIENENNLFLYAYSSMNIGEKLNYLKFVDKNNTWFKGVKMKLFYFKSYVLFIRYLTQLPQWIKMTQLILSERFSLKNMFKLKSHTDDKTMLG